MMPIRIQRRLVKGWTMPPGAIYVGRSTKWGNPWSIRDAREAGYTGTDSQLTAWCVELFREWLFDDPRSITRMFKDGEAKRTALLASLAELRGHDLACWCPISTPERPVHCHGDVLLELANVG